MPTYQYMCTACGEPLEVVQAFTDESLTECPECGGQLRKLFNAVGIVFKGSGFYRTDSRSGSSATVPSSNGGGDSSSGSSAPSTSESSGSSEPATKSAPSTPAGSPSSTGSTGGSSTSGSAA